MSPIKMLSLAFGGDTRALMDAFGIVEVGRDGLDLTPGPQTYSSGGDK